MSFRIRACRPKDTPRLYNICLRTGDSGNDASSLYSCADILGDVYVGPYVQYYPQYTFVLEDTAADIEGYIVGAFDTEPFHTFLEKEWYPKLRRKYPQAGLPESPAYTESYSLNDKEYIHEIWNYRAEHRVEFHGFPSELHINLLPEARGQGQGYKLMETLLSTLKEDGSPGVQFGVDTRNTKAISFYKKMGFKSLVSSPDTLRMGTPF